MEPEFGPGFNKGLLMQQSRDLDRHLGSLALFGAIAVIALLLTVVTSHARILSGPRLWLLDFFDHRMSWSPRWILDSRL